MSPKLSLLLEFSADDRPRERFSVLRVLQSVQDCGSNLRIEKKLEQAVELKELKMAGRGSYARVPTENENEPSISAISPSAAAPRRSASNQGSRPVSRESLDSNDSDESNALSTTTTLSASSRRRAAVAATHVKSSGLFRSEPMEYVVR